VRTVLGEQIGQETGQITGMRVLPSHGGGVKVEVSFQASGTMLGLHENNMGTYVSVTRPNGTLVGEGQGVMMTDQGEMAEWRGNGIGKFTGHGTGVSWRGITYYQTTSERLAQLNSIAEVFEFETDESGKSEAKSWEWK
jgi:hypothetical protein